MKKILIIAISLILLTGCQSSNYTTITLENENFNGSFAMSLKHYEKLKSIIDHLKYENRTCDYEDKANIELHGNKYVLYIDYYNDNYYLERKQKCAKFDETSLNNFMQILYFNVRENDMDNISGVKMEIKEGTLTQKGATVVITDTNEETYIYDDDYFIDVKKGDAWTYFGPFDFFEASIGVGYVPNEEGKLEFNMDWTKDYGKLGKGEYRIVKSIYACDENSNCKERYFSVNFIIK